jgi:hypothetical protein
MRVERLEVKRFGWVLGRKVRRSIPCYEALELVDPGNVIEACLVRLREGGPPSLLRAAV